MRKWKKTSFMCAAALAASLTLAGCGGGSSNTSASGDSKAKGSDEPVELSFSWWGNDDRHQATQKAIDAFNAAHEGKIKVTGEPSGFGNLEETFATRYAGGTAADVMTVNYPWILQYSPKGDGFYDLDQIKDTFDFTQYDTGFLEFGKSNGKMQAIPYGQNTLGVYLNKSAFDRAGIKEIPKTFEEYKAAAKIITEKDPNTYLIVSPTFRFAATYYLQQKTGKGEFADDLSMNYTLDDYKEALAWYKDLSDAHVFCSRKDYIENVGNDPVSIAQNPKFISGGYLGVLEWTGGIASNAKTLADKGDELIVAPLPVIEGAKFEGTMAKPSLTLAISKDSKHPKEAAEFLQYILNDKEGTKLMGSTRGMVASKAAKASLEEDKQIEGAVKQAYDFTKDAKVINNSPIFENSIFTNAYDTNYEKFEFGQSTLDETAKAIFDATTEQVAKLKQQYGK
ncbi:ABC transporter substrate-binding protein [Lacrimispora algidixylanolytica]|uniref:ABC transporter substrate-binding protein n=1 Tax=Lacrimispora algidixylanolytica TaxID=94868 RepID=A0A419SY03_9FIRM|nr:extracellular solute-binding protein [Lacrimispora algidixylanolytica]RKD30143.1 ABC transporter substrate-binding protein [Lacrimispora algidixylanolytica]